jgi:hypothetical protein
VVVHLGCPPSHLIEIVNHLLVVLVFERPMFVRLANRINFDYVNRRFNLEKAEFIHVFIILELNIQRIPYSLVEQHWLSPNYLSLLP